MDTKIIILQVIVSVYVAICVVSAEMLTPGTLELWVGTSPTLTCRQRGQSGTNVINDPVYVIRTPDGLETKKITGDSSKFFLVRGIINLSGPIPERHYQLGISEVSVEDDGMKIICISEVDSMDSNFDYDDEFQHFAKTLKVKAFEGCPTSSSEPNFLISTEKTKSMEETTITTSGSSDAITSRRDQLTTGKTDKALPKFEESDPDREARKQNGGLSEANSAEQGEADSTEKRLDTMTLAVIVLAACFGTMILTLAACAVLYYKLHRTKYLPCGSPTNTTFNNESVIDMQTVEKSNGHLPETV